MKKERKSIGEIRFIQSYSYGDKGDITFHEVTIEDFIQVSKNVENSDISDTIKIVGKDWWITTDDTDEGYFKLYEMPKKPRKKINLAKELLLNSDRKTGVILGIEYDDIL